ncbi:MAG: c-type cytochrome domain-containing protein, partial [Pirellulaceae bacterium]|nr:c-type cytochrome domain-containing protein [Pirellulaceae bacterium]
MKLTLPLSLAVLTLVLLATAPGARGQQVIPLAKPNRSTAVDFTREVLPILRRKCLACHSESAETNGGLSLDSPQAMLKGGDTGPAIAPKNGAASLLIQLSAHREEPHMPPPDNDVAATDLTPAELGLLQLWIDQGARGGASTLLSPQAWQPLPSRLNPIYAVAISADGQFAACGRANQIFIYHVGTGALVTRLTDPKLQAETKSGLPGTAHRDIVQSLTFNAAGDMLASGGFRVVKLWKRPRDVQRFAVNSPTVTTVAAAPTGEWIATAGGDKTIRLWKAETGEAGPVLSGHLDVVTALAFSPDGKHLFSTSQDKSWRQWNVADGKLARTVETAAALRGVTLVSEPPVKDQPPSWRVVTAGDDKFVRSWSYPADPAPPLAVAKASILIGSGDGKLTAIASSDGKIRVLDENSEPIKEWQASANALTAVSFTGGAATPTQIATADATGVVQVWNIAEGTAVATMHSTSGAPTSLALQSDAKRLAVGFDAGAVSVWNVASPLPPVATDKGSRLAAVSADRKRVAAIAVRGGKHVVVVRDVSNGKELYLLEGHTAAIRAVAFRADGAQVATAADDKTARLWTLNAAKPQPVAQYEHAAAAHAVGFHSNGQLIVSGAADGSVVEWKAAKGELAHELKGHTGAVTGVAFTNANEWVTTSADKTIRFWNAAGAQTRSVTAAAPIVHLAVSALLVEAKPAVLAFVAGAVANAAAEQAVDEASDRCTQAGSER